MGACREEREVWRLLRESGAENLGIRKHEKWRLPDGSCVTLACTCSDLRYWKNMLSDLRRALGLSSQGKPKEPPRAPRKKTRPRPREEQKNLDFAENYGSPGPLRSLAEQLGPLRKPAEGN